MEQNCIGNTIWYTHTAPFNAILIRDCRKTLYHKFMQKEAIRIDQHSGEEKNIYTLDHTPRFNKTL